MRFEARWDGRLRLTTAAVAITFGVAALALLWLAWTDGDPGAMVVAICGALLLAGMVLVAFAWAPRGYVLEGGTLRILRRVGPRELALSRVCAAGPIGPVLRGAIRLGGSSGMFGWFGRYWTRSLGQLEAHATRTDGLVQLDTPEERFVLSPEPADRFLDEVLARAPAAVRVPPEGPHARHPIPRRTWLRLGALVLAAPLVVAAFLVGSFGWAPEGATVDPSRITIARRWVDPVEIPIADVRKVEILGASRVGKVHKVAGFVDPRGRAWGRFRSEALGEFQLYLWRRGPWVLVDTDGGKVVLTPEDPEQFVGEVGAALVLRR
ncbi:MAG TPA: PH domain-containing protein [Anaeromyxobacter sp.]